MQYIGKIDKRIFEKISNKVITEDVVITEKQKEHIKERHPKDNKQYYRYLKEIVEKQDYIIRDTRPNTGFLLKEIKKEDKRFQLILRLHTSEDNEEYRNSIITFLKVGKKKYNQYLRKVT